MCGIAGLYDLTGRPVRAETIQRMCRLIRHRGPDDRGVWTKGPVGLGHERLSIIDLSPRGRNPMSNEEETLWLVANGEIYNFQELRTELIKRGHPFKSATDTEVILHLYEEEGPAFLTKLNGMFAFALWDDRNRRLFLARDRFGVKPLYYTLRGKTLAFASEIKAFLALPEFQVRTDLFALAEHFTFQNTFGERTFFEGVKLLPAGHFLVCEKERIQREQYWDLHYEPQPGLTLEDWATGLRERFERTVTRQLMSDVPLGTYLSGGMDTGAISAVAARHLSRLHTFTCGFDIPDGASEWEQFFDERVESERLAHSLGTLHHTLELGPEAFVPALPHVIWHLDEPRVGISYQVYYTAEMIRRFVTVVLSGVGGDELFAGYPWRYESIGNQPQSDFEKNYYEQWVRLLQDEEKKEFFSPEVKRVLGDFSTFERFREVLGGAKTQGPLDRALYFDFKTFLNGLLIVDDKLSMAHSLEARVPFLDNDLVDYVSRIPMEFKFNQGEGKRVLREAMKGLLPEETLRRRKQGFTPPDQTWYKRENSAYLRELILGKRALSRGYFEPAFLEKILEEHLNDRRNHRFLLWSLMGFEWWNRLFIDREALPPRPLPLLEEARHGG